MNDQEKLQKSVALHRLATDLADEAFFARRAKDNQAELRFTREAFVKEAKSAELLRHDPSHHMHATLHRSAATLAYRCGEYKAAEQLLFHGLLADPGDELRDELYDLLAKVRFRLSLNSDEPPLENDDITMTLLGPDADSGLLEDTALSDQVKHWGQLIRNTASHENGFKISEAKKINRRYRVLIKPPAYGSFKITMKLIPIGPQQLPGFEIVERVSARIIHSFDTLKKGRLTALKSSFANEAYYHDFMALATDLAPDGELVTALSIEAGFNGARQTVLFDRTKYDLESVYIPPADESEDMEFRLSREVKTVTGELKYADARSDDEELELIADNGTAWKVFVPLGFDENVVKKHYKGRVQVSGRYRYKLKKSNRLLLESIRAAE